LNFIVGDGEDAPLRSVVLGPVLPRRVNAAVLVMKQTDSSLDELLEGVTGLPLALKLLLLAEAIPLFC